MSHSVLGEPVCLAEMGPFQACSKSLLTKQPRGGGRLQREGWGWLRRHLAHRLLGLEAPNNPPSPVSTQKCHIPCN